MKPRILVVEDDPPLREMLLERLRAEGFLAVGAGSLKEGMERLTGGLWDLPLLDLSLPDGSGIELVRQAAGLGIPPLVLTGAATSEEARRCLQAGAADLMTKPVDPGRLLETVRKHCPPRDSGDARYRVLVVEDDADLGRLVQTALTEAGFDAVWVPHPEEGLRLCETCAFPVVVSDWRLPGMDGLDFLERAAARIQPRPHTILMTGHGSVERAVDSTKRGVDDYLEKPFASGALVGLAERGVQRALWARLPLGLAPRTTYAVVGGGPGAVEDLQAQLRRVGLPLVTLSWGDSAPGASRRTLNLASAIPREGLVKHPRAAIESACPGLSRCPQAVVFTSWEPLRAELGFDSALRVVQGLREAVEAHGSGCLGLVPVARQAFTEAEWSRFTWGLQVLDLSGPSGKAETWRRTIENLHGDERALYERAVAAGGSVLQSELVAGLGMSKAKVTRVLSRLESRGLLERKREGMGNRVVLQ